MLKQTIEQKNTPTADEEAPEELDDYMKQFHYWKTVNEKIDTDKLQEKIKNTELGEIPHAIKAFGSYTLEIKDSLADYDTILSDDHSGRTAALFTRELAEMARKKAGKKTPDIKFTNGIFRDDDENNEAVREHLKKLAPKMGRTLLAVESINSGERIEGLCKILDELNIDYAVSAISTCFRPEHYRDRGLKFVDNLKFGEVSDAGMKMYDLEGCGIEKDPSAPSAAPGRDRSAKQRDINEHRESIRIIAEEMKKLLD